jgi:hypothetical protein
MLVAYSGSKQVVTISIHGIAIKSVNITLARS